MLLPTATEAFLDDLEKRTASFKITVTNVGVRDSNCEEWYLIQQQMALRKRLHGNKPRYDICYLLLLGPHHPALTGHAKFEMPVVRWPSHH